MCRITPYPIKNEAMSQVKSRWTQLGPLLDSGRSAVGAGQVSCSRGLPRGPVPDHSLYLILQDAQVQISMADKGEVWQNGYTEHLIQTIKEKEVDLSEYLEYHDHCQQIGCFRKIFRYTSGSILRWGISPQPNSRRSGFKSTL